MPHNTGCGVEKSMDPTKFADPRTNAVSPYSKRSVNITNNLVFCCSLKTDVLRNSLGLLTSFTVSDLLLLTVDLECEFSNLRV